MTAVAPVEEQIGLVVVLSCPCGRRIGQRERTERTVVGGHVAKDLGGRWSWEDHREDVVIGGPVVLEPGFINAKRRHKVGHPWYVRGDLRTPERPVRAPAVVTCSCGQDVLLAAVTSEVQRHASMAAPELVQELRDELADADPFSYRRRGTDAGGRPPRAAPKTEDGPPADDDDSRD